MEQIVRTWTLFGTLCVALAIGTASAFAGVSFFGILIRVLAGASVFLIVSGVVAGLMVRSLLVSMARSRDGEHDTTG
jgi:hypothetical protein